MFGKLLLGTGSINPFHLRFYTEFNLSCFRVHGGGGWLRGLRREDPVRHVAAEAEDRERAQQPRLRNPASLPEQHPESGEFELQVAYKGLLRFESQSLLLVIDPLKGPILILL